MSTDNKHTPVPWRISPVQEDKEWVTVLDIGGNVIANVNSETGPDLPPLVSTKMPVESNAAFIVKSCNEHATLEQIAEAAQSYLKANSAYQSASTSDCGSKYAAFLQCEKELHLALSALAQIRKDAK